MDKGQFESGCSSAATHRLTQASTTLNRRYVQRPTNLAIEEAAQSIRVDTPSSTPAAAPSRLVNLGIHRAELEAALAAPEPTPPAPAPEEEQPAAIIPTVYEFGQTPAASTFDPTAGTMMSMSAATMTI